MSNICDTQYKVRGSRKVLSDLWNTLQMMEVNRLLSNKKALLCVVIIVVDSTERTCNICCLQSSDRH